ncbi:MAG: tyrosine-type recombinase/integrase [Hafnia sp.]|uniref:phage integrase n=1 Tax=Hafniaceae TaxID=1903412 RepID=UPI00061D314F|nr:MULTISPECIES: tyrosine-type recombinase/integrase [Hafniaceae]KKF38923.1 integrase [Hafnia alvei]MBW3474344.1 tyrosine-type recombinase/integrase [Hafnia alvei]
MIKTLEGGRYKVDVRPRGAAGRRIQRVFIKKADALAFEKHVMMTANSEEWKGNSRDYRELSELFSLWWKYEGRNLEYAEKRKKAMETIISHMGNPPAYKLTPKFLSEFRSRRLYSGVKASTINRDITMISSMFTVLISVDEFSGENPFRAIKPLKEITPEMTYLTHSEIEALLSKVSDDALRMTLLCLSTGGRWGEVLHVKAEHIQHNRVTFFKTKNGKHRTIPLSDDVITAVKTKETGMLFSVDYAEYRKILKSVKPDLPRGQAVHVLRHTFAAHFMMNGGNILTLQKIMGHASIQQTMTYAHLSPDYLQDAISYNPLRGGIKCHPHSIHDLGVK